MVNRHGVGGENAAADFSPGPERLDPNRTGNISELQRVLSTGESANRAGLAQVLELGKRVVVRKSVGEEKLLELVLGEVRERRILLSLESIVFWDEDRDAFLSVVGLALECFDDS